MQNIKATLKLLLFPIVTILLFSSCTKPQPAKPLAEKPVNNTNEYRYQKVCLEGHVYYEWHLHERKGGVTIKLSAEGKPVACKTSKSESATYIDKSCQICLKSGNVEVCRFHKKCPVKEEE